MAVATGRALVPVSRLNDGAIAPRLVYSPHPIMPDINRQQMVAVFLPGETVLAYLSRLGLHFGSQPVVLQVNGQTAERYEWATIYCDHGDIITIRATMHGGDGASDPLRTVLNIAVLAAAVYFTGPAGLGLTGTSAAVAQGLIVLGGMMLVNTLVPPPTPVTFQDEQTSPTYSLSGGQNRSRLYQPLPLVMGQQRVFPDLGAKPYTEFRGNDQYLYQVFNFGLGDINLSNIKIGDTPIASYQDVTTEISGTNGALDLFPANVDSIVGASLTVAAGWTLRTGSIDTTGLVVDFSGLVYYVGDRGLEQLRVTIGIQYRAVGSGAWLDFVTGGKVAIDHGSKKPLRRSYRKDVAKDQYEIRIEYVSVTRRKVATTHVYDPVSGKFTVQQVITYPSVSVSNPKVTADVSWDQFKSYQPDTVDYTGQKRLAMIIKASGQLNGTVDRLNAIVDLDVPVWTSATWVTQASSNPAWIYLAFARGALDAGGQRLWGANLPDARIDIETIKVWGAWCDTKALSFNFDLDTKTNVFNSLQMIARCGRAAVTWSAGILGIIWDEANKPTTAMFGMSNIRRGTFSVEYITGRLADEVIVEWINPALNWQPDTVRQVVPGVSNPVNPVSIKIPGITNESQAGREANLIAAEQLYRRRIVSWETDIEGMVVQRGDVIALSHDLTRWAYSGRLITGTTTVLQLDRKVPFTLAETHYIGIRSPDGTIAIYDVIYQVGEQDTITLNTAMPSAPDDDPDNPVVDYIWFFAPKTTPGKQLKITDIRPLSQHHVRITATDEDDAYYLAENDTYTYVTPQTFGLDVPTLTNLQIEATLIPSGNGFAVRISAAWDVAGEYGGAMIRAGINGEDLKDSGKTLDQFIEFDGPEDGTVTIEVTGFNQLGQFGSSSRITDSLTYVGKATPPQDVAGFIASQNGNTVVFKWFAVPDADLFGYEIRYGLRGIIVWDDATPLTIATKGTNITSADIAPGDWSFFIKAIDATENASVNATLYNLLVDTDADVITQQNSQAPWPGNLTGFYKHWTGVLVPLSQNLAAADAWETFDTYVPNPVATAIYEAPEIDIGFDDKVRVWGEIDSALGPGETGVANPSFELDYHLDAGAYDGFEAWSVGQIRLRYAKAKLTLDTSLGVAYIKSMQLVADQEERTQKASGVTIAAGGTVINFSPQFHTPPFVRTFTDGVSGLTPTRELITETSFKFHLFNSSGSDVGGIGSWEAIGV